MKHHFFIAALIFQCLFLAGKATAVSCTDITHQAQSFTICEVRAGEDLRLFLRDNAGDILGSFASIERETGRNLLFAMNAGMYHDDRAPVGLYVEEGTQEMRLVTNDGPGNFGLLPNGVFCIGDYFRVIETLRFQADRPDCTYATQSGPMLVIDGVLHPRFIPGSTSRFIRNGVGTSVDGRTAIFAISNVPVNFHDFATLFQNRLNLPNALYFDGKVSRLYDRANGRADFGWQLGPIVGVLAPQDPA